MPNTSAATSPGADDLDAYVAAHPANSSDDLDTFVAQHPAVRDIAHARHANLMAIPPPPEPSLLNDFFTGTPAGGLMTGMAKGAGSTLYGLGKLAHHIIPVPDPAGAFSDQPNDITNALEPKNNWETAGKIGEQVGEAFVPSGIVNRTIQGAAGLGKLARVGVAAGAEGLAGAGIGAAQSGGDPLATGLGAAGGAVFSGLGQGLSILGSKALTRMSELAREFNVPITKAQQTGGTIRGLFEGLFEGIIRRTLGGATTMSRFDLAANKRLLNAASSSIVDTASAMEPHAAGEFIQQGLALANETSRKEFGAMAEALPDAPLNVNGETQKIAASLLQKIKDPIKFAPSLGNVDDVNRAVSILEDFANTQKKVSTGLLDAQGNEITREEAKTLTFHQARELRTLLGDLAYSGEISIGKGALKQMRAALDNEMGKALDKVDPDAAILFRSANARYVQVQRLLESSVLERVIKEGEPEKIVDTLIGSHVETKTTMLRSMFHTEGMDKIQAAVWKRILERSQTTEGLLLGDSMKRTFDAMGEGAQKALFSDPQQLARAQRLLELADKLAVPRRVGKMITQQGVPFGAQMQLAGGIQKGLNATRALLEQGDKGDFIFHATTGGAVLLTPAIMAKMMTSKSATEWMIRGLTTSPGTAAAKRVAGMITTKLAEEAGIQSGKNRSINAGAVVPLPPSGLTNEQEQQRFRDEHPELYPSQTSKGAAPPLSRRSPTKPAPIMEGNDEAIQDVPMAQILPPRFKNAISAVGSSPIHGLIVGPDSEGKDWTGYYGIAGLYGEPLPPQGMDARRQDLASERKNARPGGSRSFRQLTNDIQISGPGWDDQPIATELHERGHAAWFKDLSMTERGQFAIIARNRMKDPHSLDLFHSLQGGGGGGAGGVPESFAEAFQQYIRTPWQMEKDDPQLFSLMKNIFGGRTYTEDGFWENLAARRMKQPHE